MGLNKTTSPTIMNGSVTAQPRIACATPLKASPAPCRHHQFSQYAKSQTVQDNPPHALGSALHKQDLAFALQARLHMQSLHVNCNWKDPSQYVDGHIDTVPWRKGKYGSMHFPRRP